MSEQLIGNMTKEEYMQKEKEHEDAAKSNINHAKNLRKK
jgi:hypothetical protein